MKLPSTKTLSRVFGSNAKEARRILERATNKTGGVSATLDPARYPVTLAWKNSCYNPPKRREVALSALNELGEFAGCEAIRGEYRGGYWGDIEAEYLNAGDTYAETLVYDTRHECYLVQSWGDWVERAERRGIKFP